MTSDKYRHACGKVEMVTPEGCIASGGWYRNASNDFRGWGISIHDSTKPSLRAGKSNNLSSLPNKYKYSSPKRADRLWEPHSFLFNG